MSQDTRLLRPTRRSLLAWSLAAPALGTLSGRGFAAETGVTPTKVTIGAYMPLEGGYAAGAAQMRDGADSLFQSVNDAGGIHGRKIEWIVENDSYNPQQTMTVVKGLVDRDGVFAIVCTLGTANNLAALPFLVQRKVITIHPSAAHERLNNPKDPYIFSILPTATDIGKNVAEYAVQKMGAKNIGVLYQNDPFGKDPKDSFVETVTKLGGKVVAQVSCLPSDVDLSAQALTLQNAKPDTIFVMCVTKQGAQLLKEMQRIGWKPKVIAHNTMADPIAYALAGEAMKDVVVQLFTATKTMGTPAINEANATIAKYHPSTQPGYWTYLGYGGAKVFVEALRRVGPDLTREKMIDTLYKFGRFEPGVVPPIEWSKESHGGAKSFGYAAWQDGGALQVVQSW